MARVLVRDDSGTVVWTERVTAADFETDHFRRCLAERLWWAVADAESRSPRPLRMRSPLITPRRSAVDRERVLTPA